MEESREGEMVQDKFLVERLHAKRGAIFLSKESWVLVY